MAKAKAKAFAKQERSIATEANKNIALGGCFRHCSCPKVAVVVVAFVVQLMPKLNRPDCKTTFW